MGRANFFWLEINATNESPQKTEKSCASCFNFAKNKIIKAWQN